MRIDAAPLPEYGMEVRADLCHDCAIAQGVLSHVRCLGRLHEAEAWGRAAIRSAWEEMRGLLDGLEEERVEEENATETSSSSSNSSHERR